MEASVKKQIIERICGCSWCKQAKQQDEDGYRYYCKKKARLKWAIEVCGDFEADEIRYKEVKKNEK